MTQELIQLRGAQATLDPRLDRIRQVDLRSLSHPISSVLPLRARHTPRSYSWHIDERLDQGQEGACVGFGWAGELAARPKEIPGITNSFARNQIYLEAQKIDEFPGEMYEGTSVLAGAKIVQRMGLIEGYKWAFTIKELIAAVGYQGPAVIGVDWYEGMVNPDQYTFISPHGQIIGGHCILIYGVRLVSTEIGYPVTWDNIDLMRSFFRLQNSWGPSWGIQGRCKISMLSMMKLWPGGDFCIPVGRKSGAPLGFEHNKEEM